MKYIYLIIIIFIFPIALISQWEEIGEKNGLKFYNSRLTQIKFDPEDSNKVFAVAGSALFHSIDNGATWSFINNPLQGGDYIEAIGVKGKRIMINNGLDRTYYTSDLGATWAYKPAIPSFRILLSDGKYQTLQSNKMWELQIFDDIIYCAFIDGIASSSNNGDSWQPVSGPENKQVVSDPKEMIIIDSAIYIAGFQGFQYTTDHGNNWSGFIDELSYSNALGLVKIDNTFLIYLERKRKIFKSTDDGITWKQIYFLDSSISKANTPLRICNNIVYFWDEFNNIKYSTDFGETWIKFPLGYKSKSVQSFNINSNYLFIGTGSGSGYGMLRYPLENCLPRPVSAPEYIELSTPPYPNPAAGIITFELPEGSGLSGSYEVYNELGEKFSPSGELGAGKLSLDASSLPIGVYVLKYISGSRLISEKFVVRR